MCSRSVLLCAAVLADGVSAFFSATARASCGCHATSRCASGPRCSAKGDDHDDIYLGDKDFDLLSALKAEVEKRAEEGPSRFGKFLALQKLGPHHTTTPRQVVEHIILQMQDGNLSQAFDFTSVPVGKRGTHASSTDWTQRMAWDRSTIINGAPSGRAYDREAFEAAVRKHYHHLLEVESFRFVGDSSQWQVSPQKTEKMTDPKDYMVELRTKTGEHLMFQFQLVYDWLVYCHLVASVQVTSLSTQKHFPGSEDTALDI